MKIPKKFLRYGLAAITVVAATAMTSCNSDEDFLYEAQSSDSALSRTEEGGTDTEYLITFEDNAILKASPTPYGDNLYASYSGDKFTDGSIKFCDSNAINFGLNYLYGAYNFWNGGVALSQWNIQDDDPTYSNGEEDWWWSYLNQCSVYNTASKAGTNKGAGAGGSDTFAIMYGYQDGLNDGRMDLPKITFNKPVEIQSLEYCNSSYVYGVLVDGNEFGDSIITTTTPLEDSNGFFRAVMMLYDSKDALISTQSVYLANYQEDQEIIKPVHLWTTWKMKGTNGADTIGIPNVKTIKFNFEGSDTGEYGLNTPAYMCIDNIKIKY